MTTVCTDGKTMAADRLITGHGIKHGQFRKIAKLKDGTIVGMAGHPFVMDTLVAWLESDQSEPFDSKGDFECMILYTNGTVKCMDGDGRAYECGSPQAIGSGAPVAYGAMAAGATPIEAVQIAAKYDIRTGAGVDWFTLPE